MTGGVIEYINLPQTDINVGIFSFTGGKINNLTSGNIRNMEGNANLVNMNGGYISEFIGNAKVDNLNAGRIETARGSAVVDTISGGQLGKMYGTSSVNTLSSGSIGVMYENSIVHNMTGGTIAGMNDSSVVDKMSGGNISNVYSGATINEMSSSAMLHSLRTGGTVKKMTENSRIEIMHDGTVNELHDNASINLMYNGSIGEIKDSATITTFGNGTITNMNGGTIGDVVRGTIVNMNAGSISNLGKYGIVNTMNGGTIDTMTEYTSIGLMTGGTINHLTNTDYYGSPHIDQMDGGLIKIMDYDTYVDVMNGGEIEEMHNASAVNTFNNGKIGFIDGVVVIGDMQGGEITTLGGGKVTNIDAGHIGTAKGAAEVVTMNGGTAGTFDEGSYITTLNSGAINVFTGKAYITTMVDGEIGTLKGSAYITTMNDGTIHLMDEGGNITTLNDGTVKGMKGGSYITTMEDGIVDVMIEDAYITTLNNGTVKMLAGDAVITTMVNGLVSETRENSDIKDMQNGVVDVMNGGKIGEIGTQATINTIKYGTIYGSVTAGSALNVANNSSLFLHADNAANALERDINAGAKSYVEVKDFTLGPITAFNMANESTLVIGTASVPKLTFAKNGILKTSGFADGVFADVTIQDFSAGGRVTFDMFVDESIGGSNDTLTIVSNTGTANNHLVKVRSNHTSTSNRDQIDLINDETGTLSLKLNRGSLVGLGAKNYTLDSTVLGSGNQWSLFISNMSLLSDAALSIGSVASANLVSLNTIQASLHQRMGDIRSQQTEGAWARTYANHTNFKDLASTEVNINGVEGGFDKVVGHFGGGKLALGFGVGINYSDVDVKTYYSKDAGAKTTMPYMGLYGTWSNCDGLYVDTVIKYAYNDSDNYYYDGADTKQKYNVNTHSGALSVEAGYQHKVTEKITLEPRAQISYTYLKGDKFMDGVGYRGKYDDANSLLGTIGLITRYDMKYYQYYAKASIMREFAGDTDIIYDGVKYTSDIGGTRGELGLGYMVALKGDINLYAEAVYQLGSNSYSSINGNLGLYWKF